MKREKTGPQDGLWQQRFLRPPEEPGSEFVLNGCTYGELYRLAGGIYRLAQEASSRAPSICICADDRVIVMAALISALAGGPRVILPYAWSRQALAELQDNTAVSFYLTNASLQGDLPAGVEVLTPSMLPRDAELPVTPRDPDAPFLTLFTGGSTGSPKGWSKTPRNMFAEPCYHAAALEIRKEDIFLSTVPANHIYGLLFSVLAPFVSSARILNETYVFPREVVGAVRDRKATVLVSVPVHYRTLKIKELQPYSLRIALSSAGVLDKADAEFFYKRTGVDVLEVFGSTETGGIATRRRFLGNEAWFPMDPVEWKIKEGRLRVRSDFLSPELPRDREGFFITADCVEAEGGDHLILRGRADSIVKVGGKRVDLQAVQSKLKQIPGVRDAFVISIPVSKGRQNEVAALAATELDPSQLLREMGRISEAYAAPKRIVAVESIPMTATGKYDRAEIEKILKKP